MQLATGSPPSPMTAVLKKPQPGINQVEVMDTAVG